MLSASPAQPGAQRVRSARGVTTVTLAALAILALSCAQTVTGQSFAALEQRQTPIRRIAVAPLVAGAEGATAAAPVVTRQLVEALVARGVEVVTPSDVGRVPAQPAGAPSTQALAEAVAAQLGADALLTGEITRWHEREGGAAGSSRPAAVGLRIELLGAPGGARLWRGEFDRTQQALMENVLLTPRYPGGGTRWLTAEEFARFAADELAAAIPLVP